MTTLTHIPGNEIDDSLKDAGVRAGADSGNPLLRTLPVDTGNSAQTGIWECQPGGWPVVDRTDTEVCYILSGRATLTDSESGQTIEISTGSFVVLPVGWTGRWDVTKTVRKAFVIY